LLLDAPDRDKDLRGGLLVQAILSAAAFVIEHPDSQEDALLVARAGLRGALATYRATTASNPRLTSPFFDHLAELETAGKLDDYIAPKLPSCK
jgi:hypothetical protein